MFVLDDVSTSTAHWLWCDPQSRHDDRAPDGRVFDTYHWSTPTTHASTGIQAAFRLHYLEQREPDLTDAAVGMTVGDLDLEAQGPVTADEVDQLARWLQDVADRLRSVEGKAGGR